jgi:hypothetical protein
MNIQVVMFIKYINMHTKEWLNMTTMLLTLYGYDAIDLDSRMQIGE